MEPVPRNISTQLQFSHVHPNHSLMHHSDDQDYTCHGCKTSGIGVRFRCHVCTVDFHVYCSDSPQELSSFLHNHRLALVPRMNHRRCDVCREPIDGMFYRCDSCDFDVHPLCSQLPEQLRHVIDDHHKLSLHKLSSGHCSVCKADCSSRWVYGCDVCRVNIHPQCLLKPYGSRRSEKPAVPPLGSRGIPYAHAPPWTTSQQPPFHGGFSGGFYPYGYYDGLVKPNVFGGYGYGYGGGGHFSPWGFPNYHISYPSEPNYYGSVQLAQNNPSPRPNYSVHTPSPSPSIWGSIFGGTMFALVENLAAGAVSEFIFGSIGF